MLDDNPQITLRIETDDKYSVSSVTVYVMGLDDNACHPRGILDDARESLVLRGTFSGIERRFHGLEASYRDAYGVDLKRAKQMVQTLTKVQRAIQKASATEAGDVFMAFAAAVGAESAVVRVGESRGSMWKDNEWRFMSIASGRDEVRRLVAKGLDGWAPS